MISEELRHRAQYYLERRQAQELDHTDPALNDARTEAHDALMMQMDIEGIPYTNREHAAQLARAIVAGHSLPDILTKSSRQQKIEPPQPPTQALQTLYRAIRSIDQDSGSQIDAVQLQNWIHVLEKHPDVPARLLLWLQQIATALEQLETQEKPWLMPSSRAQYVVQKSLFEM